MVALHTPAVDIGIPAPNFNLPATDGKYYNLQDLVGDKGLVVAFICNHCPFVQAIKAKLMRDAAELAKHGINFVAINSNDADTYPADSFENMGKEGYEFPYLYDESQQVAKLYDAVCTPDFYGFDSNLKLQYRGRLDDAGMSNKPNSTRELYNAMVEVAQHGKVITTQNPSIGCSIKWRG